MRTCVLLLLASLGLSCAERPESRSRRSTRAAGDADRGDGVSGGDAVCAEDCMAMDDACNIGVCDESSGQCVKLPTNANGPCGVTSSTECGASMVCDNAGHCVSRAAPTGTPCDDCAAGAGNCGGCGNFVCRNRCGNDLVDASHGEECDGTDSAACPGRCRPDCTCLLRSCRDVLRKDQTAASGVHQVSDSTGTTEYDVHCDMTTDGGGWTLLGTISGADDDRWNSAPGLWADAATEGTAAAAGVDYKALAWSDLDVRASDLLLERRFDGVVAAQVKLSNVCLLGVRRFAELFVAWSNARACTPADMTVLTSSPAGLADPVFEEGAGARGLGNAATNGLCWMGEDTTTDSSFRGHLMWHDVASTPNCSAAGHAGGIAVVEHTGAAYTDSDIAPTSWLAGTDLTRTALAIYARDTAINCSGDAECVAGLGDGYRCEPRYGACYQPGSCDESDPTLAPCPSPTTCAPGFLGGDNCHGCTVNDDCRAGEICMDSQVPGLDIGCVPEDFLGGGLPLP